MLNSHAASRLGAYATLAAGVAAPTQAAVVSERVDVTITPDSAFNLAITAGALAASFRFNIETVFSRYGYDGSGPIHTSHQTIHARAGFRLLPALGQRLSVIATQTLFEFPTNNPSYSYLLRVPKRLGASEFVGAAGAWDHVLGDPPHAAPLGTGTAFFYYRYNVINHTTFRSTSERNDGLFGGDDGPGQFGGQQGYIGFRLTSDDGATYNYGFIQVGLSGVHLEIHGWSLETDPNTPIRTPAPGVSGLALLAMGAAGIRRMRRDPA